MKQLEQKNTGKLFMDSESSKRSKEDWIGIQCDEMET